MRALSFLAFISLIATNVSAMPQGSYNSVYFRYVPGDGIGVGRFVPQYWERQYLLSISGSSYRLDEAHCSHDGRWDSRYGFYSEEGYFYESYSGVFTKTVQFYSNDGRLRRTCEVKDGSAQPSSSEVFAMDCGGDWRWSFEQSFASAGYDFCRPW